MQETANGKIHKLEVTDDTLTSRGGLAFFVKYLEAIGIVGLLLHKFAGIKKSIKGVSVRNLFLQVLYFFFDGTSRHLSYFDELQPEEGYQAVVEMPVKQMASSQAMKPAGAIQGSQRNPRSDQSVLAHGQARLAGRPHVKTTLTEMDPTQRALFRLFALDRYRQT